MTAKKKAKRTSAINGRFSDRGRGIYNGNILVSVAMVVLYVILSAVILVFSIENFKGIMYLHWSDVREFLLVLAFMVIFSTALSLYVAACQPRIVKNHLRGMVLLVTLLIMTAIVRLGVVRGWSAYLIVVPVMIVAVMMTIAYTQRFALGIGSFLLLVSVLALHENSELVKHSLGVLFTSGGAMGIAVLSLREIRSRSKLIQVCLLAAAVVFVMIWLVGLWQGFEYQAIFHDSAKAAVGAIGVGFALQGFLPLIEKIFRTATSLTLLDYSEANKPLLRKLAVEAPGTFNHSLLIGMLAEAAAEASGASGLLCRVGAYYHDIGKLNKPRYFVENQAERFNQHKELSPTMSRMIIIGHVKDGLELARQYKLPRVLHQFIATHHGTTLVEYFYHEATKKEAQAGRSVTETEFRYPGPKPQTREAAIVMFSDAVEGATRAMQDPTPSRIENIVEEVGMRRLQDGQFDQCDLTMRELKIISGSLIKSLCAMYHSRIAYPKRETTEKGDKVRLESIKAGDAE